MESKLTDATDIVEIGQSVNTDALFTDRATFDAMLSQIEAIADSAPTSVEAEADRKEIASIAYKIAKVKTRVDDAGKALTEDARKRIDAINGYRRTYKEALQSLQDKVRQPLTEYEEAEKARKAKADKALADFADIGQGRIDGQPADFDALFAKFETIPYGPELGEFEGPARAARDDAKLRLDAAYADWQAREAERAELEALRQEKAEREAAEIAARRDAAIAERAKQEERDRIAKQEAAQLAEVEAKRLADEKRAQDAAHVMEVQEAAAKAIMQDGVSAAVAIAIVKRIKAGGVPNVSIRF